jgi:hypothetical protein
LTVRTRAQVIHDPIGFFKRHTGSTFDTPGKDCVTTGVLDVKEMFKRRLAKIYREGQGGDTRTKVYTQRELDENRWRVPFHLDEKSGPVPMAVKVFLAEEGEADDKSAAVEPATDSSADDKRLAAGLVAGAVADAGAVAAS